MRRSEVEQSPAFVAAAALSKGLERSGQGRYQVEGEKLVRQALDAGRLLEAFVLDDPPQFAEELAAAGVPVHSLPAASLPRLIGTSYQTSIAAVGIVRRELLPALPDHGLLLAGEGIQDPRNVGVLIRTAEAAGAAAVAFSDDSADPFARAAVRSTTGSLLRQPVYLAADLLADLQAWRAGRGKLVATSAKAGRPAWDIDLTGDVAIMVGNESTGLSPDAVELADELVALPMAGGASSLNVTVAAGALLYEAVRQRRAR